LIGVRAFGASSAADFELPGDALNHFATDSELLRDLRVSEVHPAKQNVGELFVEAGADTTKLRW